MESLPVTDPVEQERLRRALIDLSLEENEDLEEAFSAFDTQQGIFSVNEYLRVGPEAQKKSTLVTVLGDDFIEQLMSQIKAMDQFFCDPRFPRTQKDLVVYRGVEYNKNSFDEILTDKAYKSTTTNLKQTLDFCRDSCVILQITIPANSTVFVMSNPYESELLLPRTTHFIQTSPTRNLKILNRKVTLIPVRAEFTCLNTTVDTTRNTNMNTTKVSQEVLDMLLVDPETSVKNQQSILKTEGPGTIQMINIHLYKLPLSDDLDDRADSSVVLKVQTTTGYIQNWSLLPMWAKRQLQSETGYRVKTQGKLGQKFNGLIREK